VDGAADMVREALASSRPVRHGRAQPGEASLLVVPLRAHHRVTGAVAAINGEDHPDFSARQLDLLMTMAAHAAAVDNLRLFEEVQRLAVTDDLTGVHNRRHLFELAEHEFRQSQRYHRPLAAIMFDLDRFKDVNDTYGHGVGDEVLRAVAGHCRKLIREVDVLGRYGGEEFAVILPETDLKAAIEVAERFRSTVAARPLETSRGPIEVTVSAGVAEIHRDMIDVHSLIDRADAAMYFAKRTGRNRVEGGWTTPFE
jgi:diguanylate cyclase (GGDEF)-like protein